ncbi:excisionase family DNA-binding protein [Aeromicrobium sp. Leaf289]|uniref:excisionase family DNA-binding protein n=1 Tax=Aeromicrobium sp. Leaf289 TaxID=1736324 RepID=UPI000A69DC58|nr:excisionase family DNA-binding protein [Aeromicrobium sp. Leaf289]
MDALWQLGESRVINPMLLTYEEVATAMSCSTRHVKRLTADGSLPSVAVGSLTRVRVVDLDAYVAGLAIKREAS